MKKIILVLSLVLVLGLGTIFAYATETPSVTEEATQENVWHEERMEYKRAELKDALENKEITQEEYDVWVLHFDDMDQFHEENGFINGGGFGGGFGRGCNGGGRGFSGGGMMRNGSNGWNNN